MKNNFLKLMFGLGLAVLPFAGGCLQETTTTQPALGQAALTESVQPAPAPVPVAYQAPGDPQQTPPENPAAEQPTEMQADAPPLDQLAEAPVQPVSTNQPVPPKLHLSNAAAEVVRLAGSGLDQAVMLSYVTNSPNLFNLGAEEIIYLNDVGVPSPVVTAMIQRDQTLKAAGAAALNAQAQPPVTSLPASIAAAPPGPGEPAPQGQLATAPLTPPNYSEPPPPLAPGEEAVDETFYEPLAPYGTWVYVAGYGRCWRPTACVVNPGWQPYFDGGHWVYTDCGWYWMSDYSWGWAPYHYGRWFRHHAWGWCWAPDRVWGPSWVAWRNSSDYCGWAPLPPGAYFSFSIGLTFHGHRVRDWDDCGLRPAHYRFVAWQHFDEHHLHGHALPAARVNQVYRNTVVVNNYTVVNHTVVNNGFSRDHVAAATHHDIRPVSVRPTTTSTASTGSSGRLPAWNGGTGRGEHLSGNTLTVYKPTIPEKPMKPATPTTTGTRTGTQTATHGGTVTGSGRGGATTTTGGSNNGTPQRPGTLTDNRETTVNRPNPGSSGTTAAKPSNGNPTQPVNPGLPTYNRPANTGATAANAPQVPRYDTTTRPSPATPAWRNADPNSRFERIRPAPAPQQPNHQQPNYQQPARQAPLTPQAPPAQNYNTQPRTEVPRYGNNPGNNAASQPRYTGNPAYSQQPRSYSPPPSSSRPETGPNRAAPSYNDGGRSAQPAQPAARAPEARGNNGGGNSGGNRNDNNSGGNGNGRRQQ